MLQDLHKLARHRNHKASQPVWTCHPPETKSNPVTCRPPKHQVVGASAGLGASIYDPGPFGLGNNPVMM